MEVVNMSKYHTELRCMLDYSAGGNMLTIYQRATILYLAKLKFTKDNWEADGTFVEAKEFIANHIQEVLNER